VLRLLIDALHSLSVRDPHEQGHPGMMESQAALPLSLFQKQTVYLGHNNIHGHKVLMRVIVPVLRGSRIAMPQAGLLDASYLAPMAEYHRCMKGHRFHTHDLQGSSIATLHWPVLMYLADGLDSMHQMKQTVQSLLEWTADISWVCDPRQIF
jgi:hypothetical protein